MRASISPMLPAFNDEVSQTQQTFRYLLTAMSEPATIVMLEDTNNDGMQSPTLPSNVNFNQTQNISRTELTALWSVAQTLLDSEVSAFVDKSLPETLSKSIRFFTGAELVVNSNHADFVFTDIANLLSLLNTHDLNIGTLEKPHTNTTVVVQVKSLSNSAITSKQDALLQVTGPGIQSERQLSIAGLDDNLLAQLQSNQRLFPCGLDWIFCAGSQFTALPRTSQVALYETSDS